MNAEQEKIFNEWWASPRLGNDYAREMVNRILAASTPPQRAVDPERSEREYRERFYPPPAAGPTPAFDADGEGVLRPLPAGTTRPSPPPPTTGEGDKLWERWVMLRRDIIEKFDNVDTRLLGEISDCVANAPQSNPPTEQEAPPTTGEGFICPNCGLTPSRATHNCPPSTDSASPTTGEGESLPREWEVRFWQAVDERALLHGVAKEKSVDTILALIRELLAARASSRREMGDEELLPIVQRIIDKPEWGRRDAVCHSLRETLPFAVARAVRDHYERKEGGTA